MAKGGFRPMGGGKPLDAAGYARRDAKRELAEDAPAPAAKRKRLTAKEYLLSVVNDETAEVRDRINCAAALLPYTEARVVPEPVGKKDRATETAKKRATGRFAPPPAPGATPLYAS
jgi:hypothetical protein